MKDPYNPNYEKGLLHEGVVNITDKFSKCRWG
jgi:hypothetical protein